jgi:hypothetical protein
MLTGQDLVFGNRYRELLGELERRLAAAGG